MTRSSLGLSPLPPSAWAWLYSSLTNENSEGVHATFAETRFTLPGIGAPVSSTRKSVKLSRACSPRMPTHQICDRRYWNDAYPPSATLMWAPSTVESFWRYSLCRIHPCRFELLGGTLRIVTSAP